MTKPIPSLPGYFAADTGQITGPRRVTVIDNNGYPYVKIKGKSRIVSRLVAEAWHGEAQGRFAWHKNRNVWDNRPSNLEWITKKQLAARRKEREGGLQGEDNPKAKLTASQAKAIRSSGEKASYLAWKHRVSDSTIYSIKRGDTWSNI